MPVIFNFPFTSEIIKPLEMRVDSGFDNGFLYDAQASQIVPKASLLYSLSSNKRVDTHWIHLLYAVRTFSKIPNTSIRSAIAI